MTMSAGQGSMLHLQSNMQHSPLGISIVNTHSGSVSLNSNARKEKLSVSCFMMLIRTEYPCVCVCFPDVSVLHEPALSRVPVSYLSLPADTPAGVFTNPNWTTGTKLWISNQETLWEVPHRRLIGPTTVVLPQGQSLKVHYVEILDSDIKK